MHSMFQCPLTMFCPVFMEFQKARIVGGDKGAGVGVMGGLREEGIGNLLGDEGRGITSVEEGLGEVSGVGHLGDCRYAAPG